MAIWNLGSVNIDHIYRVPHLPGPGETLSSTGFSFGLGGKGANQSIAAALSGARVHHIGAIGAGGDWIRGDLMSLGIDLNFLDEVSEATGHAIIYVDDAGENVIVLHEGANHAIDGKRVSEALGAAMAGDWFLLQNETNYSPEAAEMAWSRGLKVAYAAAPFSTSHLLKILPLSSIVALNEIEAEQLVSALGHPLGRTENCAFLITKGAAGAEYIDGSQATHVDAFAVEPIDTTGAGDTFLGFFLGGLDQGRSVHDALHTAAGASAIQVTRKGAAEAIPTLKEVETFLKAHA